jgi:hypothetical protein
MAKSTDTPTCSVCPAPAVYEIVDADPEKGNLACEDHKGMWYNARTVRLDEK